MYDALILEDLHQIYRLQFSNSTHLKIIAMKQNLRSISIYYFCKKKKKKH